MLTVYTVPGELTSPRFGDAFARGAGATVTKRLRLNPGDVAMFGSPILWPMLLDARDQGRTWYYGDHAYFGRREYYRVTRNAFMAQGTERHTGDDARLAALGVNIQTWRRDGRHILICPPGPVHANLMRRAGVEIQYPNDWGVWAMREVAKHTDRPLRLRTKAWARATNEPLEADLKDCWAVVVFMSNVGVEAALAGVPVFVLGPSAARAVGCDDLARIETPLYPDNRHEFACSLAGQQWTLEEIAAGQAWEVLRG